MGRNRYALVTVDTEALPKRASADHLERLIWGQHERGRAGIREMCAVADEFGSKLVFFVDACGSYFYGGAFDEVVRWLDGAGHDVQLHTHSEYLPEEFWTAQGFRYRPRFLNQYDLTKAEFTIRHFSKVLADLTGKPVRAFRAGSFRWNANTIRALEAAAIPLSFNNSMHASLSGQCTFSTPGTDPYRWSNGVLEVPVTERRFFPLFGQSWWGRLQFPVSNYFRNPPWRILRPFSGSDTSLLVLLMHSWSLLQWDAQGHGVYRNDKRVEDFRKLMRRLTLDYDVITTAEFLDLVASGAIGVQPSVDLYLADMQTAKAKG